MDQWLINIETDPRLRDELAWKLLHFCLSAYNSRGPILELDEFEAFKKIMYHIVPPFNEPTDREYYLNFIIFLYHYTVERYGHKTDSWSILLVVELAIISLQGDQQLPPIRFPNNAINDPIPFPHDQDNGETRFI